MMATACFQQVGDVPQANAVSERQSETPSNTPSPTDEPTATATENPDSAQAQAVDQPVSEVGTSVAQSGESGTTNNQINQPDPFQLTATELIRTATEGVQIQMTETAIALGLGATATPSETPQPTQDPFAVVTPTQPTQFISGSDCVHEVRAGETMYRLSVFYGLPVNTIAAANGIVNPNVIVIEQRITIPGCGTTGAFPPATSTPIPSAEALFGTGGFDSQTAGSVANQTTGISLCGSQVMVEQYETLFEISLRCGVPVQSIANANGITNINRINMGDVLAIPPG